MEVTFTKAKFSSRIFAFMVDAFLMIVTALGLVIGSRYLFGSMAFYQNATNKITEIQMASHLYYKDEKGNIIKDPLALFEHLQVGDLLIYSNPKNPEGKKGKDDNGNNYGFTGHTASIISKTKNYVITLEFHENGKDPTINLIYKNTLLWFNDTDLYGGASWK